MKIKEPNVAGAFYPRDGAELNDLLDECFKHVTQVSGVKHLKAPLKAIVAPHAGYIYSGPIAASAYQVLKEMKDEIKTVVVLSPSHFYRLEGIAVSDASHFKTPLGNIEIDQELQDKILNFDFVVNEPMAFEREHALEVHLPFLQKVLGKFKLVPLVVGYNSPAQVQEVIETLSQEGVFFVVSSDLSHFHDYDTCKSLDKKTSAAIEAKEIDAIDGQDACGYYPLRGLLSWAKNHHYQVQNIDLRNSGDTAGDKSRVVGYGSYLVY